MSFSADLLFFLLAFLVTGARAKCVVRSLYMLSIKSGVATAPAPAPAPAPVAATPSSSSLLLPPSNSVPFTCFLRSTSQNNDLSLGAFGSFLPAPLSPLVLLLLAFLLLLLAFFLTTTGGGRSRNFLATPGAPMANTCRQGRADVSWR